ncbi:RibD family protein [Stappia sp. F7233]|uniref:RibD family protein n=1 Tax=Stappia albiluteola TaxID=2758565 RepID=A0A839AAI5_9HYPH|nr:RibD family protein [Stappia albiluteola]MBA5775917.1 RibD family protein [Stappia albiluteola]
MSRRGGGSASVVALPDGPDEAERFDDPDWLAVLEAFQGAGSVLPDAYAPLFGPLLETRSDLTVVGQLGQSLDGRIATVTGHSKYINGPDCLAHLHRLRAVCDAVVVGVGTAICDRPRLTVRLVAGRNPARVVIDPRGRLEDWESLNTEDGARCLLLTGADAPGAAPDGVEVHRLGMSGGNVDPHAIRAFLSAQGFRRVLLEGGAQTISRFIDARALDRLHLLISPVLLGSGPAGLQLPAIATVDEAIRPPTVTHCLGSELLVDCDLSGI